jgi:hypothetical protein
VSDKGEPAPGPGDTATTGDPKTQALRWVREQGFGLEHRAAEALGPAAGFVASRVTTYKDTITRVIREVDVVSRASLAYGGATLLVVVECKRAKKPWIAVTTDMARENAIGSLVCTSNLQWWFGQNPDAMKAATPVQPPRAYRLVQAHSNPDKDSGYDPAYAALSQLLSAAKGVAQNHEARAQPAVVLPALVIDQPLYVLSFEDDAVEHLDEAPWVRLLWSGDPALGLTIGVDVVRDGYLAQYAREMRGLLGDLADILQPREGEWRI